jgi:hypothetical protein
VLRHGDEGSALAEVREVGNYEQFMPGNVERFCEYWGRGY